MDVSPWSVSDVLFSGVGGRQNLRWTSNAISSGRNSVQINARVSQGVPFLILSDGVGGQASSNAGSSPSITITAKFRRAGVVNSITVAASDLTKASGLRCLVVREDERIYACDDTGSDIFIIFWNDPAEDLLLVEGVTVDFLPAVAPFGYHVDPATGEMLLNSLNISVIDDCTIGLSGPSYADRFNSYARGPNSSMTSWDFEAYMFDYGGVGSINSIDLNGDGLISFWDFMR